MPKKNDKKASNASASLGRYGNTSIFCHQDAHRSFSDSQLRLQFGEFYDLTHPQDTLSICGKVRSCAIGTLSFCAAPLITTPKDQFRNLLYISGEVWFGLFVFFTILSLLALAVCLCIYIRAKRNAPKPLSRQEAIDKTMSNIASKYNDELVS